MDKLNKTLLVFIRFLKKRGIYSEYRFRLKKYQPNVLHFFLNSQTSHWISEAFIWPNLEWHIHGTAWRLYCQNEQIEKYLT